MMIRTTNTMTIRTTHTIGNVKTIYCPKGNEPGQLVNDPLTKFSKATVVQILNVVLESAYNNNVSEEEIVKHLRPYISMCKYNI